MFKIAAKIIGIVSVCLFFIMAIWAGGPVKAIVADTVRIGQIDPFSGPFESTGRGINAALRFAVAEQNAKGGLLGKKVELLTADCEGKPDVATRRAKEFILKDKVIATCGAGGTHIVSAMNKVASNYKTINLNFGALSDFMQGKGFTRYAFRMIPNGYAMISVLAKLMATKPYRKFYIICQDYAWGHDVARAFKEQIKAAIPDVQIVGEDYHPIATKDFAPYITKVIAAKADAIFTGNWGPDAWLLVKQARELGLKSPYPMVMPFGVEPPVENELQDAAVGIYACCYYSMRVDTPENKTFIEKYRQVIGKNEKNYVCWWPQGSMGGAALGLSMFFAAVEKAGSFDSEKIIDAFEGLWHKTPVGWWQMRKCDHQVILPMFGGMVQAGDNPWYNGSIDPNIKFPWMGAVEKFSATETAIPPTSDYNKRCP